MVVPTKNLSYNFQNASWHLRATATTKESKDLIRSHKIHKDLYVYNILIFFLSGHVGSLILVPLGVLGRVLQVLSLEVCDLQLRSPGIARR